jgi:hypothetical protein
MQGIIDNSCVGIDLKAGYGPTGSSPSYIALARNTILARVASRRVMTHLWRLLSMKALEGKATHITGAGTPYGDRLDRAPRTSGRWRRGFGLRASGDAGRRLRDHAGRCAQNAP